nr:hypothetical protein [Candidatus Sigynarchaeota archaeon]
MSSMKYLLIIDVDGTINLMGQKFDITKVPTIPPMENAREILEKFKQSGSKIVYLTGRSEKDLKIVTANWLHEHGFPDPESIVFFQPRHGPWTWKSYLAFKQMEVDELRRQNPGFVPVVVDDSEDILACLQKIGVEVFKVRQPDDWLEFQQKYMHGAPVAQLDDFLGSSSNR